MIEMTRWNDTWPAMRLESHFGDRVVRCFVDRPKSLHALLAQSAARYPQQEALVCGPERFTWQQLHDASARLAAGLRSEERRVGKECA